jgi:hypothetical protein
MRATVLYLAAVLFAAGGREAHAGWSSTRIALVNLDDAAGSTRFEKFRAGVAASLTKRHQVGEPYGVVEAVVVTRARLAPLLTEGCALAKRIGASWMELSKRLKADFLVLYCSKGPGPDIEIVLYQLNQGDDAPRLHFQIEAKENSVGRELLQALAHPVALFADKLFSP